MNGQGARQRETFCGVMLMVADGDGLRRDHGTGSPVVIVEADEKDTAARLNAAPGEGTWQEDGISPLDFLELEVTGLCNLRCRHCFAGSSPQGDHGTMAPEDWERVITEAAGIGVRVLQVIGGEATLYPELERLVRHALGLGLQVTVYSNLVRVTERQWALFQEPGVRLAVSWFAADPGTHADITGSRHAYGRTRASIARAVDLGIPLRVMVIAVDGRDTAAAEAEARALGAVNVKAYRERKLGRADDDGDGRNPEELCGGCGGRRAAVLPDGTLVPCTMARWLPGGSVRQASLPDLLGSYAWRQARAAVPPRRVACGPDSDNSPPDDETIDPAPVTLAVQAR